MREFVGGVSLEGGYHPYRFIDVEIRWNRLVVWNFTREAVQHTQATHCNTLQHTAAHCNTLQHMPIEATLESPSTVTRTSLGCLILVPSFIKTLGAEMTLDVRVLLKMQLELNT